MCPEDLPVVEVVQVNRTWVHAAFVGDAAGVEDAFADIVSVDVTADGDVVFVSAGLGDFGTGLSLDPSFELGIAGLCVDEGFEGVDVDAEGVQGHLVIATADAGILGVKLPCGREGGLLPKAGEVDKAERAGNFGTNQGNNLAHG